ncbi:MAG: DegT/DnrJ/EryC1/StrS family aminotransferase [Oligoflexia bacterium]|nr:DegT/DnrJ/EryC1/StrS family aminotransferase [Oligoflexia bacterium]
MISLFGSHVGNEELESVKNSFDNQWLGIGNKCTEFEKQISDKINSNFVFLNSGSNSLIMALRLLNLPEGSEVILPSFTWIACANAVLLNKLVPRFCDVEKNSCNMRPQDVAAKITKKTSAIMVVHYAGKPVDMDGMKQFGLPIVEDAAHSIDSFYKGKHLGTIGEVGIFSFDAVKNITTGEGGGIISNNQEHINLAKKLRYCGISKSGFQSSSDKNRWWEYEITDSFPKMLNTDIAASIGLVQLKKLPSFQEHRRKLWKIYSDILQKEEWANNWLLIPPGEDKDEQHSFFTYCLKLRFGHRDNLARFLFNNGVYSSLRFHPLHMNPIYRSEDKLENSEWLNEVGLNIPLHHRLTEEDVYKIIDLLKDFRIKHV